MPLQPRHCDQRGYRIQVTVTVTEPTHGLELIGVRSISVTQTAIADLVTGVVSGS